MPASGYVNVEVHDILGRKVLEVSDGFHSAGPHVVPVSIQALRSGTYFIILRASGRTVTKKIMVTE